MSALQVTWGLALRNLRLIPRLPSTFIPSLVMPVFLTIAFTGAFSGLVFLPGFPAEKIVDWVIPMTILQGAAFAGVTTGMGAARDLENGFFDRFLTSPAPRGAILAAPLVASFVRAAIPIAMLLIVAVLGGAHFYGGALGIGVLLIACFGMSVVAGAYALGVALRLKTQQAAPLMQTGVFLLFFLSTAQMPLEFLTGWLHTVARFNPMTNVLELGRQGFLGEVAWASTWPGLVALGAMLVTVLLFAARGMQRVAL